jgi:hypothetical protein
MGPGSAEQRYTLHRVRDTNTSAAWIVDHRRARRFRNLALKGSQNFHLILRPILADPVVTLPVKEIA